MEMEQDLINDFLGTFKARGSKEDPTETYKVEGKQNAYELEEPGILQGKLFFYELIHS